MSVRSARFRSQAWWCACRRLVATAALLATTAADTVPATVVLPPASCGTDVIFASGFETVTPLPSGISITSEVTVPGFGTRAYYLRLPPAYSTSERPFTVVLALHGAGGAGTSPVNAQATRNAWASVADANQVIVAAPASNGAQGGWGAAADIPMLAAIIDQLAAQYRLDRSRLYLWGFSAGAHYGHALALDNYGVFAAYGISAGTLYAYACDPSGAFACPAYLASRPRKVPVDIHIGIDDPLFGNASGDPARFLAGGWAANEVNYVPFDGGHAYTVAQLADIYAYLCRYAVAP